MHRFALVCLALGSALTAQTTTRYRDQVFTNYQVRSAIAFGAAVNRYTNRTTTLLLDLYEPRGDTESKRPAIVLVHGGGFRGGSRRDAHNVAFCRDLARRGFVVASIDYRLRPSGTWNYADIVDASHDLKAAVRFLRRFASTYRIDPTRLGTFGGSAGAITCLEAAAVPGEGKSGNPGYSSKFDCVVDLWGYLHDESTLDAGEPAILILHGTRDTTIPYARATALAKRAAAVGVPYELVPLNGGHSLYSLVLRSYMDRITAFYWQHLRLAQLAGLRAGPGYRSPGALDLLLTSPANRNYVLCLAGARQNIPLGRIGTLCLPPAALVVVDARRLSSTPRLPIAHIRLNVPTGVKGTIYWQAGVGDGPGLTLATLTNCTVTRF